jgi:hypothetical protein
MNLSIKRPLGFQQKTSWGCKNYAMFCYEQHKAEVQNFLVINRL